MTKLEEHLSMWLQTRKSKCHILAEAMRGRSQHQIIVTVSVQHIIYYERMWYNFTDEVNKLVTALESTGNFVIDPARTECLLRQAAKSLNYAWTLG